MCVIITEMWGRGGYHLTDHIVCVCVCGRGGAKETKVTLNFNVWVFFGVLFWHRTCTMYVKAYMAVYKTVK